ncbi:MAG TPA: class II aldolase/adducin family protein [Thermoanaerobaculia bacterium]|nr:class II aldolase/adducin family protein [Thermoanaerobaculia bacterium]
MRDRFAEARYEVFSHARKMWEAGLVVGSSGNLSARVADDPSVIAITPTSVIYDEMSGHQIVVVDLLTGSSIESKESPSCELPMHRFIYRELPSVSAIVHTHSPFVTTLSILRRPLPPVIDEMLQLFGGMIEVADYAPSGSEDLGRNALRALGNRTAAILANHGNVCIGPSASAALQTAIAMEAAARIYLQSLQVGEPFVLRQS